MNSILLVLTALYLRAIIIAEDINQFSYLRVLMLVGKKKTLD
jgi:hypothetical protein